jgi:hypothetical protein
MVTTGIPTGIAKRAQPYMDADYDFAIIDDAMIPAYKPGELALISSSRPIEADKDVIVFRRRPRGGWLIASGGSEYESQALRSGVSSARSCLTMSRRAILRRHYIQGENDGRSREKAGMRDRGLAPAD